MKSCYFVSVKSYFVSVYVLPRLERLPYSLLKHLVFAGFALIPMRQISFPNELRTIPFKDNAFPYPLTLVVRNNYPKPTLIKELVDFLTYSLNSVLY